MMASSGIVQIGPMKVKNASPTQSWRTDLVAAEI